MTNDNHFLILQAEISSELSNLDAIIPEWDAYSLKINEKEISQADLRVVGSMLHDFYTCIERVFSKIAVEIDGELPSGSAWHSALLDRMNISIPGTRGIVIDDALKQPLYEYLRFRHVFRNVYGWLQPTFFPTAKKW